MPGLRHSDVKHEHLKHCPKNLQVTHQKTLEMIPSYHQYLHLHFPICLNNLTRIEIIPLYCSQLICHLRFLYISSSLFSSSSCNLRLFSASTSWPLGYCTPHHSTWVRVRALAPNFGFLITQALQGSVGGSSNWVSTSFTEDLG